ncbi:ATPase PAAT isoform X1 [Pantherophis guttatus]|uniref:ATPase PAAT isoform X1 n=2 Tax=Pantherophis guttatus TaxID=94885 RepID=A0A6P9D978_PANGU|nr:ATPase PAAT isoform X1 [Pantherophis guttatus]
MAMASSNSSLRETPQIGWDVSAGRPRVSVACSWKCPSDLARVLCVVPAGEFDAEELSEPAANGQNVVVLEGEINDDGVVPCLLYLHCDPCGSEEIVSLSIISEARNMEVYLDDEYYGTGRGERAFTVKHGSNGDQVSLYKKYLKLECSTVSCKIKLLSISEKQRVLINKIIVQVQSTCAKTGPSVTLGSGIDLDKVQTIMESMGSKLSPGAQQLLDMVRFQQKNGISFGGKLQTILGGNGFVYGKKHPIDGLKEASDFERLDHLSNGPSLLKTNLVAKTVSEDLNAHSKITKQVTGNIFELPGLQPCTVHSESDCKGLLASFFQEQRSENSNIPNSTLLLPLLQTVCGQVDHLSIDEKDKCCEKKFASQKDGIQTVGLEQQHICLYLEKFMSKRIDLTEKRLMDYIDLRMQKLQEHIDNKLAAVMDLVNNLHIVSQECGTLKEENTDGKRCETV